MVCCRFVYEFILCLFINANNKTKKSYLKFFSIFITTLFLFILFLWILKLGVCYTIGLFFIYFVWSFYFLKLGLKYFIHSFFTFLGDFHLNFFLQSLYCVSVCAAALIYLFMYIFGHINIL